MAQSNLSTKKRIMDLENRLVVAKGEREGVGWMGCLELIDTDYCLWNGLAMRSCCVALGTLSSHLWWNMIMWEKRMYTCMCNWVTMLCSRKKNFIGEIIKKIVLIKKRKENPYQLKRLNISKLNLNFFFNLKWDYNTNCLHPREAN